MKRVILKPSKASRSLYSFALYCKANPEQRFFQALCNWIGCKKLKADGIDTYYYEDILDLREVLADKRSIKSNKGHNS